MIDYDYIVFQWDKQKDVSNLLKHGLSFAVAHRAFFDKNAVTQLHQVVDGEQRWKTLGMIENTIIVFIGHLVFEDDQDREVIRIIAARKADRREIEEYYHGNH